MSEKVTVKVERNILHLPAIALRGLVVFPNNLLHFEVGRDKSIAAVEWAVRNKSEVFLIAQKDMKAEDPKAEEMYQYGVVARSSRSCVFRMIWCAFWWRASSAPSAPSWIPKAASCWHRCGRLLCAPSRQRKRPRRRPCSAT